MEKTLNLKPITRKELQKHWGKSALHFNSLQLFIRCNKAGKINWDKAPVYTLTEVLARVFNDKKTNIIGGSPIILDQSGSMQAQA
jgi:hypothetical protein